MACSSGRFLLPLCKRRVNKEGLGSSMGFWRAGMAYASLLNLTLASDAMVVGHGLGTSAHSWLGLGEGLLCDASTLRAKILAGILQEVTVEDQTRIEDLTLVAAGQTYRHHPVCLCVDGRF